MKRFFAFAEDLLVAVTFAEAGEYEYPRIGKEQPLTVNLFTVRRVRSR